MARKVQALETSIEILATPATVWAIVSDQRRMKQWSPETFAQKFFGRDLHTGSRSINLNKRKAFVWPTASKVTVFEADKKITSYVYLSGSYWTYELQPTATGTLLTERRELKGGKRTVISKATAAMALGGVESHDVELIEGMNKTLARIKAEAESA